MRDYDSMENDKNITELQLKSALEKITILENTIREQEALRKSVVDYSLDGTIIVDSDFNVIYANDEACTITGYNESELTGQDIRFLIHKNSLLMVENKFNEIYEKGGTDNRFECDFRHKTDGKKAIFVSASIMDDFKGKRVIVVQVLDISEIKAAQEKIMQINEELEQRVIERTAQLEEALTELKNEITVRQNTERELHLAKEELSNALAQEKELNTLKSRFISMISHEYRTPLTVILTSTYLLERLYSGDAKPQFDGIINKIRGSVKLMTQLLEDVLTIGKSDAGKIQIYVSKLDLVHLIREIIDEVKVIDNNRHDVIFETEARQIIIDTDERNLRHVLNNLVGNAAKYSPNADRINIKLEENNDSVTITIQDFGIGIPQEDLDNLFEAFFRGSNVGAISGTGLGLAIVVRGIKALNGDVTADSKLGEGSTFTVSIPKVLIPNQIEG